MNQINQIRSNLVNGSKKDGKYILTLKEATNAAKRFIKINKEMNRINKFKIFENISDFSNIIKDCFNDLIDDEIIDIDTNDDGEIVIWLSIKTNFGTTNINDFFKSKEEEMNILNSIKLSLERMSKIYDVDCDVDCEFNIGEGDYQLTLILSPGVPKEGEFYKETKHGIKINYSKLQEILKLPRNVDISLSLGSGYRLNFRFINETELEKYKDKLIEGFMKLKINNKPLSGNVEWSRSTHTGAEISPYKVRKNYKSRYRGPRGEGEETINSVEFGITDKLEFTW